MNKVAGRYQITARLGEGGMGVVYRAYDPAPVDREVAVKTLHQFTDAYALELFYKECSALKSISHPNIVEIFDIGEFEDDGTRKPFFVMPLLQGQTLDQLIRTASHRLTVDRVVEIVSQTCRGLQAAHERGVIHRDLKPSNIFVMADDSVKIIDFGVAHAAHTNTRSGGGDKGTLIYMAPEQVQHKPVSVQSDIYALGVTAYEALTRRQPFRGATYDEVTEAILTLIPPPVSQLNPSVSDLISRVVHRAMAKQPWNRYDTAREFGETLQKALRNEPIALFDASRLQPRIQTAARALEKGDYQFAAEIVTELEAEGNLDPEITLLRTQIDQIARQKTIAQLLDSARARYEEAEDPLALQKLQEVLQLDPGNMAALGLKSKIDERRSAQQIDKWLQLARQHIHNHSYGHAREALQNALLLRPKDSRAARLLKDVEAEEQDYVRLRQEKTEIYQAAVNAWKNGEVSQALTQMKLVMELDRRAPDPSSTSATSVYHSFYNKIRSEHDAISTGYAEARRHLAEREFAQALGICRGFLEKYPGHALFQALTFDIEEQQRQQLSAFIADIERRLEAEPDLEAKVSLLREAAERYPEEGHFARVLAGLESKRQLVNSIVERARVHEERGLIQEALNDFETLQTIYGTYPGLAFEKERLRKRLEQHTRSTAKARWVRQIDQSLDAANFARALELVDAARTEFPDDTELVELRKLAEQGIERAGEADRLTAEGQGLCADGRFDEGVELLRRSLELDDRPTTRLALCETFVARGQDLLADDWQAAAVYADRALEIDPNHTLARNLRARVLDQKREVLVGQYASEARRLQAAGNIDAALAEVNKGLEIYPADPRLRAIFDALTRRPEAPSTAVSDTAVTVTVVADRRRTTSSTVPAAAALVDVDQADTRFVTAAGPGPAGAGAAGTAGFRPAVDSAPAASTAVASTAVASPPAASPSATPPSAAAPASRQALPVRGTKPAARHTARGVVWATAAGIAAAAALAVTLFRSGEQPSAATTAGEARSVAEAGPVAGGGSLAEAGGLEPAVTPAGGPAVAAETKGIDPSSAMATVTVRRLPPGTVVSVDGVLVGEVKSDGTLSHTGLTAGAHTIQFARSGFEPATVTRQLEAAAAVTIDGASIIFRPVAVEVEFLADAGTEVTVAQDGATVQRFTGAAKVPLGPGNYEVTARGPAGIPITEPLSVSGAGSRTLDVRHVPSGMERFEGAGWSRDEAWFSRRGGGFVLYDRTARDARVAFTIRPDRSRNPFSRGPRVKWVVGYVDPRNYLLVELDDDYLYRTEVTDGARRELPRVAHRIRSGGGFLHLSVAISPAQVVHQVNAGSGWTVIDTWNRTAAADGRFGFYLPGSETLEVSNFRYDPVRSN